MAPKKKKMLPNSQAIEQKKPVFASNPEAYLTKHPNWRFYHCVNTGKWDIGAHRSTQFWEIIWEGLKANERLTWQEIQSATKSHGSGSKSHFVQVSSLCKDAQDILQKFFPDVDTLFSLRLDGKKRIYGIMDNGTLELLWYDENHEIYPCDR